MPRGGARESTGVQSGVPHRPGAGGARESTGMQLGVPHRPGVAGVRGGAGRRGNPSYLDLRRAACHAGAIMAYDSGFYPEVEWDVGHLGGEAGQLCCEYCAALLFDGEQKTVVGIRRRRGEAAPRVRGTHCCCIGKVRLPAVMRADPIEQLWLADDFSRLLQKYSRKLNNQMALASSTIRVYNAGASAGQRQQHAAAHDAPTASVVIEGKLYTLFGPLEAAVENGEVSRYAQLYCGVHDDSETDEVSNLRFGMMRLPQSASLADKRSMPLLLHHLDLALRECNPYISDILTAHEILRSSEVRIDATFHIDPDCRPRSQHERRYDPASSSAAARLFQEVTVFYPDRDGEVPNRAVTIRLREGGNQAVHETHRAYDALHFPLLFPCGDDGYRLYIPHDHGDDGNAQHPQDTSSNQQHRRAFVTAREFYAHMLQVRNLPAPAAEVRPILMRDDALTRYGRLFQEYCCTAFARQEAMRLRYLSTHQQQLRVDQYRCLEDAVQASDHHAAGGADGRAGGNVVVAGRPAKVLPSSFSGGSRDLHGRFQDSMAIVRQQGKPSYFITATCNPKWPAVLRELKPGQQPHDRPDLLARVFHLMLKTLLKDLRERGIFGEVIGDMHTVEFQKGRCLPHAHIFLIMASEDRVYSADHVDDIICAELPPKPLRADFDTDERFVTAYNDYVSMSDLVAEFMVHNLCGPGLEARSRCMKDGHCTKGFPKESRAFTEFREDESYYPLYRRRAPDGVRVCSWRYKDRTIDNQWVVPYSPYLLRRYKCHINVEFCASVMAIKYAYKYIFKGADRAMVSIEGTHAYVVLTSSFATNNKQTRAYTIIITCDVGEASLRAPHNLT